MEINITFIVKKWWNNYIDDEESKELIEVKHRLSRLYPQNIKCITFDNEKIIRKEK